MRTMRRRAAPRAGAAVWPVAIVCTLAMAAAPPAWGQCDPQELAKLLASDAAMDDWFGLSVSVSSDTALIGAMTDSHAGGTNAGSAYLFDLGCAVSGDLDGDVDLADYAAWDPCLAGPGVAAGAGCEGMDLDADGDVDVGDFAVFQASYTGPDGLLPPGCQPADLDNDKDVDVTDFAAFQEAFAGP